MQDEDVKQNEAALHAMTSLDEILHLPSSSPHSLLHLSLLLAAKADALVATSPSPRERRGARLGAAAYAAHVLRDTRSGVHRSAAHLPAQGVLEEVRRRSRSYVEWAARGTTTLAQLGGKQMRNALQSARRGEECVVLAHGASEAVLALLTATASDMHFTLLVSESSPSGEGHEVAAAAALRPNVRVRMIEHAATAHAMAHVHLVLCGAHAVRSDGVVVGPIGSLGLALVAREHRTPFCVAAPHYAFFSADHMATEAQEDVLHPDPLPQPASELASSACLETAAAVRVYRPTQDCTPPHLVSWVFSDLGVLAPSAVVDFLHVLHTRGPET